MAPRPGELDPAIFRAYDIRGVAGDNLTDDVVFWVGQAFAENCRRLGVDKVTIGGDGRASTAGFSTALSAALTASGLDVLDIGMVPTPTLYFAANQISSGTGIMITGSHNPPDYNGLKMMIAGRTLAEDGIQALRGWIETDAGNESSADISRAGMRQRYSGSILDEYVTAIVANIKMPPRTLKVVVDSGNGVGGLVARGLFEALGCDVVSLFDDVDPTFPNHHPDPAEPENLIDLQTVVRRERADVGLAFDGDADRLGVVSNTGRIMWPDQYLMHFAETVLPAHPNATVVFDVKCSSDVRRTIERAGGRPIMWKTGHSHMKAKLKDEGAVIAGEFSGHICFADRWNGMDDAMYAAARFVETLGEGSVDDILDRYPANVSTPELKIATSDTAKFEIVDALKDRTEFPGGVVTDIDGIRVDFEDGWGLLRPSNTSPVLSLRFEARSAVALARIQKQFNDALREIDPTLAIA